MVFAGEGLRAPQLPPRVNNSPPPLTGRAVAGALIGAAAAAGLGTAAVPLNLAPTAPPPSIQRTAPAPSTSAVNPLLSGARVPSLGGGSMPSVRNPAAPMSGGLPSVGGGLPRVGGGGAATAVAGVGIPLLADALGRALTGGNPLDAFKSDPRNIPFSPEATAESERMGRQADAERESLGNAFRNFGDFLNDPTGAKKRAELERVGNKFRNPPRKGNGEKPSGIITGKMYAVTFAFSGGALGRGGGTVNLPGAIGSVTFDRYTDGGGIRRVDANFTYGGGNYNIFTGESENATASINSKIPLDGIPDPSFPATPESFNDGNGLALPTTLGNTPILPNTGLKSVPPTKAPAPGSPNPVRSGDPLPSNQRPGDTSKQPQGEAPTVPQMGSPISPTLPTLPNIPAAPTTGSTTPAPIFPSPFTATAQRNDEALKPIEPQPPKPPQPRPCADPCMATLQGQQLDGLDALQGLAELLAQLLAGQQQIADNQQQQEENQNELSVIQVPLCSCNPDGSVSTQQIPIQVPASAEASTLAQFNALAAIQTAQCQIQRHSERSHNILGGDAWFEASESADGNRQPLLKLKVERELQSLGTLFGFDELEKEDPNVVASEEELERRSGGKIPVPGRFAATNLPDLLNAYTSTLYHRAGFKGFPTEVPATLLGYSDTDKAIPIKDLSSYFVWFVKQFDALVGKFPIEIVLDDADPAQKGKQAKTIELPNISEALAEMYGITLSGTTNSDLSVNMLARIAVETVAAKNAALIGQDYSKANASFLGYKGNTVKRDIQYAFNPTKFDTLDEFLSNTTASIQGWEEQDPETVVGFLQRIVFAAGIIKSVFFRDKKLIKQLEEEAKSLLTKDKETDDASWLRFIQLINNADSQFNKGENPQPKVDKEAPSGDSKPKA